MKSTADEAMARGFKRMVDLDQRQYRRSVFARGKHIESIDLNQLPVRSSSMLVNSSGQFYFIVGYSIVGGGDVVRP